MPLISANKYEIIRDKLYSNGKLDQEESSSIVNRQESQNDDINPLLFSTTQSNDFERPKT